MNQRAVEEYYHKDFLPILSETYGVIKEEMKREESKIKEQWMKELQQAFETIQKKQKEKTMESISFLNFTFLRTRYMQKNYSYAIYAYGEKWYFGKEYMVGKLDVSFFFKHFETVIKRLQKEALKYFGKVQVIDVERLLLEETGRNVFFMQSLFRKWMQEICQMGSFQQMEKNPYFRMELGEYYEPGIFLYTEDKKRNDKEEKRRLRKKNNHCGRYLENINLDSLSFVGKDFVDTNFKNASMRNSKWDNCAMQGADFSGAILSNAQFYQCIMQESIWKNSDFQNVLFEECMMYCGEKRMLKNFLPDYQRIDMEQCCLHGTKFIRCVMNGMDFSKADITDCTFEDCELSGCTFTKEQLLQNRLDVEKWKLQVK